MLPAQFYVKSILRYKIRSSKTTRQNQVTKNESTSTPSIEEIETSKKVSRNEAIKKAKRIKLENDQSMART